MQKKTIPYQDEVKIRLFSHMTKKKYPTTITRWGVYHLVPEEDDPAMQSFSYPDMKLCYVMTPALKYFLNKELTYDNVEVIHVGNDEKLTQFISEQYDQWLAGMYDALRE